MPDQNGQPGAIPEGHESDASRAVNGGPSLGGFIFDPEIDDPNRDVLFEFIIAGTWEKALAVIDEHREITSRQAFWVAVKEQIERCEDDALREQLIGQCSIAFQHLTGHLSADEREQLHRFPKPRAQGDLNHAHQIYSGREQAITTSDRAQERSILRRVLTIDPCATPVWFSLAALAQESSDSGTCDRCMHHFALSLMSELDIGLFALRHGVQKAASS